jgi:two-component system, OmpR family, sensor histidine kinase BaeS
MTYERRRSGVRPLGAYWWRRRFLRVAVLIALLWVSFGLVFGMLGRNWDRDQDESPGPPALVVAVVGAAVIATFVAYRRLARPVSELLDRAERLGGGEYDARVRPSGPRAVRTLGRAFNDMAGQLEASEDARRRFLADVTHELRTPLTVLHGEIEAQLDGIHPRDDAHLERLLDQARTLDRLVEDLRTLALGDAGQLALHREAVSMGVLVDDAVSAIAAASASRGITITTVGTDRDDLELDADPVRIGQVLTNLLSNALRHTPRHSGLGLTIARQLVEGHGGSLRAANTDAGGARFTVTLPRR